MGRGAKLFVCDTVAVNLRCCIVGVCFEGLCRAAHTTALCSRGGSSSRVDSSTWQPPQRAIRHKEPVGTWPHSHRPR
mgnify:CR=1 FL=1